MAHYPRWIESHGVDSTAMFSAYSWFLSTDSPDLDRMGFVGELTNVNHGCGSIDGQPKPLSVRNVECRQHGCQRCFQQRWGYTFRWFSLLWSQKYVELSAPGSWQPGDNEKEDNPHQQWDPDNPRTHTEDRCQWPQGFRLTSEGSYVPPASL